MVEVMFSPSPYSSTAPPQSTADGNNIMVHQKPAVRYPLALGMSQSIISTVSVVLPGLI